jgi:sugar lactone lactonase YvrE
MNFLNNTLKALCVLSLPVAISPAWSDEDHAPAKPAQAAATTTAPLALKSVWAKDLRQPQGIARDGQGNVYIAEYKGGQIAKFDANGKLLAHLGTELKSPAWIIQTPQGMFVSERKANRILKLNADGSLAPVPGEVVEPLGLAVDNKGRLIVIAHTTSRVFALENAAFTPLYQAAEGKKYGYRNVAVDADGSLLISDEVDGVIRLLTPGGRMTTWASGLDSPTAVVIAPDKQVYALEEGNGRLVRIDANGSLTVVADGLGEPRDVEFLDAKTALVSDRDSGTIYQIKLP